MKTLGFLKGMVLGLMLTTGVVAVSAQDEKSEFFGLYRYCPWMRGMATSQISCNNGIDKKASHVPL